MFWTMKLRNALLLSFVVLGGISIAGCCGTQKLSESDLTTEFEIKKYIIVDLQKKNLKIQAEESVYNKQKPLIFRLILEPDFERIKRDLSSDNVVFESGTFPLQIDFSHDIWDELVAWHKKSDGRDYSSKYIYENNVICYRIESFVLLQELNELKIRVVCYRSGMDGAGYTYVFRRENGFWRFYKVLMNWVA